MKDTQGVFFLLALAEERPQELENEGDVTKSEMTMIFSLVSSRRVMGLRFRKRFKLAPGCVST